MRIYQCDSCNKVISDPYTVKMKEFRIGIEIGIPLASKKKIKIHLCDDCYKGLHLIGELVPKNPKKEERENNG
ncbi:hypothetical protein [uncultured Ruminococcus sp.]|uniref:hypothetical protein n=1 Tax=uncultured Ruminococcus sp. TaxID=165186 RepID=UPI0025EAFF76|nr:hypothetical protein [uncultured Ruminococcus sp.]